MKQNIIILILLTSSTIAFCQDRKDWTELDYLNQDESYPFETEKDFSGEYFITLSDKFDYYNQPIIIRDKEQKEIVRIEFKDNRILTTYRGRTYKQNDLSNPLSPWLLVLNPDYFRLALECIDTTENFYVVKLNEEDLGFIDKTTDNFQKEGIEEFFKDWLALGIDFDRSINPLREKNDENSQIIQNELNQKYKIWTGDVLEMNGDWLKIKTFKEEIGWLRWRKGNEILIRIYYAC